MKINFEPVLQLQINRYRPTRRINSLILLYQDCLQTSKAYFHITSQHQQAWDLNWSADIDDFCGTLKEGRGPITGQQPTQSPLITGDLAGKNIKLP